MDKSKSCIPKSLNLYESLNGTIHEFILTLSLCILVLYQISYNIFVKPIILMQVIKVKPGHNGNGCRPPFWFGGFRFERFDKLIKSLQNN